MLIAKRKCHRPVLGTSKIKYVQKTQYMDNDFGHLENVCILLTGFVFELIFNSYNTSANAYYARCSKRFGLFCCRILNVLFKSVKR